MTKKKIIKYKPKVSVVSVAEGKKRFSSLVRDAEADASQFIVTKRGKPVAAADNIELITADEKLFNRVKKDLDWIIRLGDGLSLS